MNLKKLLLFGCLSFSMGFSANAQIVNAAQPITAIAGTVTNTGMAIAPDEDIQAVAYDDGFGNYEIKWIESATNTVVDIHNNPGNDPDVAYYGNADALVVAYEDGGAIYVDDYYLATLIPTPDYFLGGTNGVSSGTYPNVDMNSMGNGVLCWEDGGMVWVCAFGIGPFTAGPPVPTQPGTQPDVILLDDGSTVALTYVDPSGVLTIETMSYAAISSGGYALWNQWQFPPMTMYEYPRIASQRNSNFGFGSPKDFAVVAQDYNSSTSEVHGFFAPGGIFSAGPIVVNNNFLGCMSSDPRPVIAYGRNRVNIAWSQDYLGGCSGLTQTSPNTEDDVLMRQYGATGVTSPTIEEVNTWQSAFAGNSRTSISAEYDGFFMVTNSNWHEGIAYNDLGDLFWKGTYNTNPNFISESGPNAERGNNFSLVTSPVDQTIEVQSESDDFASFQLLDNAGRVVELRDISNDGNVYSIDITHLSGGMYFLNCSSAAGQEVLRVLQVNK